jgi:hypothetical protein
MNIPVQRKSRAVAGLCAVGIPLLAAWIWQTVEVRNYDRSDTTKTPVDWNDPKFASTFILFILNWVFSALWQYITMYFVGCFSNNPRRAANNAGVLRGVYSIGEAIGFGVDSRGISYLIQSSVILGFYFIGFCTMAYLALFVIKNTRYFEEEEVTIPKHVELEHAQQLQVEQAEDSERGTNEISKTTSKGT